MKKQKYDELRTNEWPGYRISKANDRVRLEYQCARDCVSIPRSRRHPGKVRWERRKRQFRSD